MRLAMLFAALLTAAGAAAALPPTANAVIASRGGDTVTIADARAFIATLDADKRATLAHDPSQVAPVLRDMLLRRAILAEATKLHWAERPDIAALLARARETALVQSYVAAQTAAAPGYPPDADLQTAYSQNRQLLLLPRQYHLAQVMLVTSGADAAAARTRLLALKAAAAPDFAAAARKVGLSYNDLGWIADPLLAPDVKQAVAGLPTGQIAGPICTASVCRLILLIATKPAGPADFAQARDTLVRALRQQRQQANLRTLENALLAKAPVRVNELDLSKVVSP